MVRLYFNSIKVQLELATDGEHILSLTSKFQFHKGTIRTLSLWLVVGVKELFQFHKGTIRTMRLLLCFPPMLLFQFHKGTIRTLFFDSDELAQDYFNSIKVQLEQVTVLTANRFVIAYFNSIKVQLERDNPAAGDTIVLNFNSIKVQLEPVNP